jgi:hypothetical protein
VGFGGSCFQGHLEFGVFMPLLIFQKLLPMGAVIILNDYQKYRFAKKYYQFFIQYRK